MIPTPSLEKWERNGKWAWQLPSQEVEGIPLTEFESNFEWYTLYGVRQIHKVD